MQSNASLGISFQSTPSVWRATLGIKVGSGDRKYDFNPRPPCGGRQLYNDGQPRCRDISIHALRVEGDHDFVRLRRCDIISIHALRAEGDSRACLDKFWKRYFNPRPPCGGRPRSAAYRPSIGYYFNPRPPCGGRRRAFSASFNSLAISIHALRVEGDNLKETEK